MCREPAMTSLTTTKPLHTTLQVPTTDSDQLQVAGWGWFQSLKVGDVSNKEDRRKEKCGQTERRPEEKERKWKEIKTELVEDEQKKGETWRERVER